MATKPENVNPFAKYVEQPAEAPPENPFAKYLTPQEEEPSQILDPAKMIAAGAVGPTAAIPLGIESAIRNVPRQVVEQQGITPVSKVGPMTFAEELVKKGPAQLFTNTARAFIKKATGESFEQQQERQTQDQIAVDRAISGLPRIPGLSQLADAGEKVSERFRESVSAAGKQAIADSQVEGNLLEAIQNRSVENLSFGKNPSFMGYALQGSQVLGSLAPIITTAVVTRGSSKAVGTVGFGMGAGEAVQDAQKYVSSLSDEQLMQSSPYFKKMVEDGVNPAEARQVVVDKAAEYAAQLQGSVSAFGSVITGKLITGQFDKLMTGPVKNRLGRIALGTTAGAAEEGTQEFLEGIAKDLGINKAVIKEIGEESFANFVLGAMGGAGPGAYRGAVAKTKEEAEKAAKAPTQADIDAQMRLDLGEGVPPAVPPAAAPAVTPAITPAPSATIEEAEVEAIAPAPRVAPTPTPMLLQTAGLPPEVAGQVQNLEGQFQMIEQRKLDPNLTEEELQIFNERQNIIQQEISQLIQAPATPQIQTPVIAEAPPIDEELLTNIQDRGEPIQSRMDAEQRLSNGEQIYGFLEQDENRPRLITSVDELAAYTPEQLISLPTAPEIVQSFPMGENSELQVIKNDKGYVTNLYDKDADQYLGMMRLFPTETFGEEAEAKAIEFARSEADKAVKFEPAAPAEEPFDLKSEQAYRMRITVEELEKDPKNLTARNINPLARELGIDIRDFNNPQGTLKAIKKTLGMPTAPEYVAAKLTTSKDGYIADKDGKPIVFYHTTRALDEKGNQVKELIPGGPNGEGSGKAIWFGPDPNIMQAAHNAPLGYEGSYTIPAYIKIQNPLYIDEFNYEEQRAKWGPDLPYSLSDERVNKLKDAGFDGIISELEDGVIDEVVVFDKNQVTFKADYKPTAEASAPTQAEINQQRQAEKKAKAAATEEEKIVDAIKQMAYQEDGVSIAKATADDFIAKHGKKMFDRAVELDLLDNEPGAGRLFPSNNFVYKVAPKYYEKGKKKTAPTVVELPKKEEAPAIQVTPNKIFTEDAATKARNRLRSKLNQLNSGIDPEFLIDGITLSGYHIEKGARTFAAYAKAMIADLGDKVKPYLKQWYNAVRDDPSAKSLVDDMDTYEQVQKAELPDTTEGAVDLMDPSGKFKIAEDISKHFLAGNGFKDILDARKFISNITGQKIEAGTAQAKEADEAIEVGVVLASRQIAKGDNVYDNLVDLYNRQPNLAVRTSTSISEQAYSTPAPLAYVASQLAGINKNTTVYEPTAGNGMLLIDASPKNVIANELNGTRYEMLERVMDGATINNENAVELDISREFDAVIANPPFGVVKNREGKTISYDVDGFKSNEIDHAIAFKALNNMKEDGRAVLIVGGVMGKTEDGRQEGYRSPAKRNFYYNLYQKYNVVDHFTVSGDLYKKQGAAYPVDVIVIAGKGGESIDLPAANVPKVYSSYEQLKEKLDEASRMVSRGAERPARADIGEAAVGEGEPQAMGRGAVRPSEPAGEERARPERGEPTGVSAARPTPSGEPSGARTEPRAEQPKPVDVSERGRAEGKPVPRGEAVEPTGRRGAEERRPSELGGISVVSGERVKSGLVERRGEEVETEQQASYEPKSQATSVGTLVPRAMRDSIEQSLQKVENEMGNLDEYVADNLGMDLETLREDFSAEQVDALALAIRNAEAGKGFIIGDQTGIGKGRVVAAMIKFAIKNGKIPIFVTEKPNLYSDMIRDLDDIGMTKELALDTNRPKVFITNGGESIPYQLLRKKGEEVEEINLTLKAPKSGKALDGMMEEMRNKDSIGDYKVIFTTYSQLQNVKGKDTERQKFISNFGLDNYMIFDESHNAGGGGETQARTKDQKEAAKKGESLSTGRAGFVRNLVRNAFGTFFSSATYAKRPDVMDLYSSTNMMLAVDKPAELAEAIKRGGVPMQQIVATMLTKDGQYIRRERTFAGVAYNTVDTAVDKQTAENMATSMREILSFSRSKDIVLKQMQKQFDKEAKTVSEFGGEKTTVQGANFGSVMHNLIDQMLLSLKSKESVSHAINRLKAGEKVVMTVSNTMGSFLQSYAEDMGIEVGGKVDLSFADLYVRYLDKQLMITIKAPDGTKKQRKLTPDELGPTLMARYNQIRQQIENSGFGSAPISPIDYMHNELRKAGYKTDEITGRTITLNYATGEPILTSRSANIRQRVNAVRGFNSGETDVIILNQAGSTGLSLHASNKVKDQRKRHMLIVQPEKNIDTHMQMLGRVHRTGQVVTPSYSQMMADIPAEMRPAAVLLKKMASLNANTTASRKSAVTAEGVVDFMNDYGGQVAQEYLRDNAEIHEALGGDKMLAIAEDTNEALEADIRRFTGYIPILPLAQQEEVYADLIDRYNELLERENSMGTNKLEAKAVDLDAETLSIEPISEDKGEDSIFSAPAFMERVDVKRTVKPYSSQEVNEMIAENLSGKTNGVLAREMISEFDERENKYARDRLAALREKETDQVKIETQQSQQRLLADKIRSVLQNLKIGMPVTIKDKNGMYVFGVITDIKNTKRTVNPASGSDWKMTLAIANGDSRSLTLNFSQIGTNYTLEESTEVNYLNPETQQGEWTKIIDIFDKGATVRREKRWMITGNILAGFAQYPGQILSYTKNDGTTGQGILLPRQFNFEEEKKRADVRLKTPDDMLKFLDELNGTIASDDNILRITKRGDTYMISVPSNKRSGGEYFLDENLKSILGKDFYKRGSDMINYTRSPQEFKEAIDYLMKEKEQFFKAITRQDEARKMFGPKEVQDIAGVTKKRVDTRKDEIRAEQIKEQARLSRAITAKLKKVIEGNVNLNIQRDLTYLKKAKEDMKAELAKTKQPRVSPQWIRTKASAENAAGNLSDEAYQVVDMLANRFPAVLDGLRLSVRSTKGGASGNFNPFEQLITIFKEGSTQDRTMRHEIAHSLEQMMTPEAQIAVVEAWGDALSKAIEGNTDKPSLDYFNAVLEYVEKPSEENYRKATNLLPDYSLYQYINPSEYWAVNAEPLMKASLGSAWQRFTKAVSKILEAIKSVIGLNNKYVVHREFDRIMSGKQERMTSKMLVEYVTDNADALKFLNNVDDFDKKFQADGLNHTPVKPSRSVKDMMLGGFRGARQVYKDAKDAPLLASQAMGGKIVRAITYVRNKNIWFGAGLEMADLALQKAKGLEGMLRDGEMRAVASIAVTNALHAGHIASEVIIRGALAFNAKTQMFQAIRRPFSMANVLLAKHDLIEREGLQRATDRVNTFFEAKRSKSIMDEFKAREKELNDLNAEMRDPKTSVARQALLLDEILQAEKGLRMINIAKKKVRFDEEQIKFYGDQDKQHPELRTMLDNWTKVNDNMIDMMLFSKIISEKRAKQLKGIKDYVPWYRIQDDMEDLHQASQMGGVKRLTNVGKEKRFEDTVVVKDIDDIVDNMLHNVAMITRNSMRNYAANRVAQQYATRNKKGQIAVFPEEGRTPEGAVRTNILVNGRRIVIEIKDPLIAEAVLGMENISMPAMDMLGALANGLRRGVTLWPQFQIRQLFMDAPTAALVTGLKDPTRVWAGTFRGFIKALQSDDPVVDMLKSYGIGGYQSYTRTPEIEYKQQIGLLEKNKFDSLMSFLDRVGDASDYGQRVSVYNNTLRQTGDEMLALLQANNVIDFLKRGSARHAQVMTKTVSFMNAYAQQIDILAMSLAGKRLTGKARGAALAQLAKTGATFGFYVLLYSMAVGDDDEYQKLDDQTKVRNIFLSKSWTGLEDNILIPMHTSASFMFKSIPELIYNYVTTKGTDNEMDGTRLRTALFEAAADSLLGPNPVPTGIKPAVEILLNRNFFTGGTVTPKGMEDLDAVEQYTAATSQLGKVLSALTGIPFTEKRVLNPIEADHFVRGLFGTTGSAVQWLSNMFAEDRPSATTRQNPLYGSFVAPDVARGNEELFYDFKSKVDNKYETYMKLLERDKADEADKYFNKHADLISARDYVTGMEVALRDINRQIRNTGEVKDKKLSPEQRRQEIIDLQRSKQEMLEGIVQMRLDSGL
jgi:tRNA G10  N-methylase Trm11